VNIEYQVGTKYKEEGSLEPPSGLTPSQLDDWECEAREILLEELKSV